MHIFEYGQAIYAHWWPLMSCAAFTILAIVAEVWAKTSRWIMKVSVGLAVFFLLFASYQAWNDEYTKTHPGLQLTIDYITTSTTGVNDGAVLLEASVNVGSPSIADQWLLEFIPTEGKPTTVVPTVIHQDEPLRIENPSGRGFLFNPKDVLYEKTGTSPIQTGGKQTGILIFFFKGIPQSRISMKGVKYVLSCQDAYGNRISGYWTLSGNHVDTVPYFPGTSEVKTE